MSGTGVWLFNINPHNWEACAYGPPNYEYHGGNVGHPWHGLNERMSHRSEKMEHGQIAIVHRTRPNDNAPVPPQRFQEPGTAGLWVIESTAPILNQTLHSWPEPYEQFIYCRALVREFDPVINDMDFLEPHDFVRFNAGANELNREFAELFLSEILVRKELLAPVEKRLRETLEAIRDGGTALDTTSESADMGTEDHPDVNESQPDTFGTLREYSQQQVQISDRFRQKTFDRYMHRCIITGIEEPSLLTLSHILDRAEYPEYAEDPENVIILNWLHHRAFDKGLFTFDRDLRIRANPNFSAADELLQVEITERDGTQVELPSDASLSMEFLMKWNNSLKWWPVQQ